jgi:aspartate racemase
MKLIGLLGGTSWPSTIQYYQLINQLVAQKEGGYHSARLLLKSIDYHEIKSNYGPGWDKIPGLLKAEINEFMECRPDCLILCNNTLHKAYDTIADELALPVPFFHAVHLTADFAKEKKYRNLLLLGTKFTMEDGFFTRILENAGLTVSIPTLPERDAIQKIQMRLSAGEMDESFSHFFYELIGKYSNMDAVILACTELPLAIDASHCPIPIINPAELQCLKACEFALASELALAS